MGFYGEQVLPRITDKVLGGRPYGPLRARAAEGLVGEVLEVGFGSGLNVPFYPPTVTRVRAVDPASVGRRLAARRLAASPVPVEFVAQDAAQLPLDDGSVDHVLTTWTLCTIADIDRALGEMRRVLRPGGTIHFLEHGRSPDANVAAWQDRLNPLQGRLFGGCHLNRPIAELLARSGLQIDRLTNFYMRGPKPFGYMYAGIARRE